MDADPDPDRRIESSFDVPSVYECEKPVSAGYSASAIITLGFWNAEHDKSAIANKLIDHTAECLRCAHDASSKGGNENG